MTGYSQWLLNDVANAVGWALVHSVWQGVAVAMMLAVLLGLVRGAVPGIRYGVACVGLGIVVLSFGVTLIAHLPEGQTPSTTRAIFAEVPAMGIAIDIPATDFPVLHKSEWTPERVMPWVVGTWLAGVVVLSFWQFGGWMLLWRYRRAALPADKAWRARLAEVARSIGVKRVAMVIAQRLDVPIVVGAFRPFILMPAAVLNHLSIQQVEAILAHELAHVRRYDYLVNLMQSAIETLLFYHPAVWWISKQIRREREYCCDELAARACGDRAMYAKALAALEQTRGPWLAPAAGGGGRGELVERVRRLLDDTRKAPGRLNRSRSWAATMTLLAVCAGIGISSGWLGAQPAPAPGARGAAPTTAPAVSTSIRPEDLVATRGDYLIAPNDLLQVTVTDLVGPGVETVRSTRVSESGNISVPILGEIKAIGLTEAQLVRTIGQEYRDRSLIRDANVSVLVTEPRGRMFSIMGAVGQPGKYAIPESDFRLLDALALSRGLVGNDVQIMRRTDDPAKARVIEVSAESIGKGEANVVIRAGDTVLVRPPKGAAAPAAGRPANPPELQQALDAAAVAAQKAWDDLEKRFEGGEAYTPAMVQLQLDLAQRIFETRRAAASSPADELAAAEKYLNKCVELGEVLKRRQGQDVTQVQISQANSTIAQAQALVLRVKAQMQASSQPSVR